MDAEGKQTELAVPMRHNLEVVLGDAARRSGKVPDEGRGLRLELQFLHLSAALIEETGLGRERLPAILAERGRLMGQAGRLEGALAEYRRAEEAAAACGARVEAASAISAQGAILRLMKRHKEAERAFARAWGRFAVLGAEGRRGLADQEGRLGLLAMDEGDWPSATGAFRRAVRVAASTGDDALAITWIRCLADALARDRRYGEAFAQYAIALEGAGRIGDRIAVPEIARESAAAYRRWHRPEEAARVLMSAAQLIDESSIQAALLEEGIEDLLAAGQWSALADACGRLEVLLQPLGPEEPRHELCRARLALAGRRLCAPTGVTFEGTTSPAGGRGLPPLERYLSERLSEAARRGDVDALYDIAHLVCDVELGLRDARPEAWEGLVRDTSVRHRVLGTAVRSLVEAGKPYLSFELSQRWKSIAFALPEIDRLRRIEGPPHAAQAYLDGVTALSDAVSRLAATPEESVAWAVHEVRRAGESLREAGGRLRDRDAELHMSLGGDVRPSDLRATALAERRPAIVDLVTSASAMVAHIITVEGSTTCLDAVLAPPLGAEALLWIRQLWSEGMVATEDSERARRARREVSRQLNDRLLETLRPRLAQAGAAILVPDFFTRGLPFHLLDEDADTDTVNCMAELFAPKTGLNARIKDL